MKRIPLLLFVFLVAGSGLHAQKNGSKVKTLDSLFMTYNKLNLFSGSVLVAQKGEVLLTTGYGMANREWNMPNSPQTKFRIGSISKQFTAMLIMQLKQAGKLDLQEKISNYLPWLDKETGGKVTVHQLLTNSSGIPNYTDEPNFMTELAVQKFEPLEYAKKYFKIRLDFEPGTKHFYSNTNYFLLALIIEHITGQPFEQVLQEKILDVAGMKNTGIDDPDKLVAQRASGYDYNYDGFKNAGYVNMASATYGCGAMFSTVEDLYLWHKALDTEKLLSAENKKLMFTAALDNYASGWIIRNIENFMQTGKAATLQVHGGRINGFLSMICRIPEQETFIVILNNSWVPNQSKILDDILGNAVSVLYNQQVSFPKPSPVSGMYAIIQNNSVKEAIAYYTGLKKTQPSKYNFGNVIDLINLGDLLSKQGNPKAAFDIYKFNASENPTSAISVQKFVLMQKNIEGKEKAIKSLESSALKEAEKERIKIKLNEQ